MSSPSFFTELRRRNVFRASAFYVASAWLLVQVATQVFPFFHIAEWLVRWVIVAAAIGLPFWALFAWFYQWTPQGLQREQETSPLEPEARRSRRNLDRWIMAMLTVAVVLLLTDKFVLREKAGPITGSPEKSIAVLPFENLSEEKQNEYFADGVQDQVLTNLAKIADLKVISRTSVMPYESGSSRNLRQIGQQLGVAYLLEGSVQRVDKKVRVTAQLIDARTDAHVWAHSYDRTMADVFAIQTEVATAIAEQLAARLSPGEARAIEEVPTSDLAAFNLYSQAKTLLLNTSFGYARLAKRLEAVDLLNQATSRDPSFFLADCLLAQANDTLYGTDDRTPARLAQAEAALESVVRLRPDAGEAHLARATHFYRGYREYAAALRELEVAGQTLPNDSRIFELKGYVMRDQGKFPESLRNLDQALELDPRNRVLLQQTANVHIVTRQYKEAAARLDRALAISPDDVATRMVRAEVDLDWKADTGPLRQTIDDISKTNREALKDAAGLVVYCALAERNVAAAEAGLAVLGDKSFPGFARFFNPQFVAGVVARLAGDEEKAKAAFTAARERQAKTVQEQPEYAMAVAALGLIDAALGRKEDALAEGRRAIELLPVEQNSIDGAQMIECLALIAALLGEKDLACEQLARAAQLHGRNISYGELKLLPFWDPLRGDPRFEKIVESLAPKHGK